MKIIKTDEFVEIDIESIQNKKTQENWQNYNDDQCCICGRKVGDDPIFVQYTTNGTIVSTDIEVENSQGCFPVGSECAKKIEKLFKNQK